MKFEFTEGQWFDGQKLSDWQKQWCLDNLEYASEGSFRQFKESVYNLLEFRSLWSSCGSQDSFGTTRCGNVKPENEITFNDYYWGDVEESTQESIFDNPRWVTSKTDMELSQGLELISGKDYEVVETIIDADGDKLFKVVNSLGVLRSYHEGHFHKVTPEDLLPDGSIGKIEESFDNLEFIKPDLGAFNHWMIKLEHISKEQLDFISTYWKTNVRFKPNMSDQDVVMSVNEGFDSNFVWTNNTNNFMPDLRSHYFSFNELFQEVTTNQD